MQRLSAASCASPDPKLYTIAPVPGSELSGGPKVIAVHGVGVARYLQRSQIVQSSADYRVVLRANSWWGEPVDAMLGRVLAEDLTQRLPQSTIYTPASTVASSPDATVELEVQRLDLDQRWKPDPHRSGFGDLEESGVPRYAPLPHIAATAFARRRRTGRRYEHGACPGSGSYRRHARVHVWP